MSYLQNFSHCSFSIDFYLAQPFPYKTIVLFFQILLNPRPNKFYIPNKISNLDNKLHEFIFNIPKILEVLCDYILTKVNKPISGQAIIDAAMVINKDIFNLTEIQEQDMRENLIEINKKRQEICFPSKKIKNDKTGEITYQNIPNKFDFSNQLSNTYEK